MGMHGKLGYLWPGLVLARSAVPPLSVCEHRS